MPGQGVAANQGALVERSQTDFLQEVDSVHDSIQLLKCKIQALLPTLETLQDRIAIRDQVEQIQSDPTSAEDERINARERREALNQQICDLYAPFAALEPDVWALAGRISAMMDKVPMSPAVLREIRAEIRSLHFPKTAFPAGGQIQWRATSQQIASIDVRFREMREALATGTDRPRPPRTAAPAVRTGYAAAPGHNGQAGARPVDIAVVTTREDEHEAVLRRLPEQEVVRFKHRTYAIGTVRNQNGGPYRVAVLRALEQGPNAGQDTARDAIEDLDPRWLALVGIGGAVPDSEITLGDVVVATRLHDFAVGALIEGFAPQFVNQGGPMKREVQDLIASLPALKPLLAGWESEGSIGSPRPAVDLRPDNFYGSDEWRERVRLAVTACFDSSSARKAPIFVARSIASSGFLIKDTATIERWRQFARDLVAVEMELSGVYGAARRMEKEYPILAIRSISDIVGLKRDPAWTAYASNAAASFFFALVANLPSGVFAPSSGAINTGPSPTGQGDTAEVPPTTIPEAEVGPRGDNSPAADAGGKRSGGSALRAERRLAATERLWSAVLAMRDILSPAVFFFTILAPSEYDSAFEKPQVSAMFASVTDKLLADAMTRVSLVENDRPYLGERLWHLFFIYRAFLGRLTALILIGKKRGHIGDWRNDDGVRQLLGPALSDQQAGSIVASRDNPHAANLVIGRLQDLMLAEIRRINPDE